MQTKKKEKTSGFSAIFVVTKLPPTFAAAKFAAAKSRFEFKTQFEQYHHYHWNIILSLTTQTAFAVRYCYKLC